MDKSPYAPYLYTNYTPSASEVLDIKDFLTEPLARLSTLDAEIQWLNLTMLILNLRRHTLSEEIEAHRALISPFRRLPLEIMGEIFAHCLPTDHNAVMSVKEAPLLLGRVCSAWRSITLSTPRLWESLHIPTPTPDSRFDPASVRKMATHCEAVREWILRSGKIPLSISLYTPDPPYSFRRLSESDSDSQEDMEFFGRVSRQIIPFSRRWKTVYLRAMESSFSPFQAMVKGDVPMLESLSIINIPPKYLGLQTSFHAERSWKKSLGLLSAPKLRRLSLTHLSECLYNLPVRWSRLTHLKLDEEGLDRSSDLRYSQVFRVLKKCPLLVSCSFRLGNARSDTRVPANSTLSPNQYTLTLPLLEHLSLRLSGRSDEAFLKYLDLPVLRHLEIKAQKNHRGHEAPENQRSVLMDLLSQNGTKLKKLSIEIWAMTEDVLIRCLKSVPSVTHLHLDNFCSGSVDEEIAYCLTPSKKNRDYLCPLLEEFHCEGPECASFSEEDLLSFVQWRHVSKYTKGGVLKQVNVIFHRNPPKNVEEFFGSLEVIQDWESYIYLQFQAIEIGNKIDARISVKSRLGHPTTTVDIKYARGSFREYAIPLPSPRAGLDG